MDSAQIAALAAVLAALPANAALVFAMIILYRRNIVLNQLLLDCYKEQLAFVAQQEQPP